MTVLGGWEGNPRRRLYAAATGGIDLGDKKRKAAGTGGELEEGWGYAGSQKARELRIF
jgi:hypothetical protein